MEQVKTIEGKNYRYLKMGSNLEKKLLILWGVASYKESVASFVNRNFSDYEVLIPEYPYHNGFEDVQVEISDIREVTDYLYPLLRYEHFREFDAIGFSFGGLVLLDLIKCRKDVDIHKAVVWASPILGDAGIADFSRSVSDVYLKTPEKRLDIVHKNSMLRKILLSRGIKLINPFQFKKYLRVIKSYQPHKVPNDTNCLFIYDPADLLVSARNIKYLKDNYVLHSVKVLEINGGGHFGTRDGREKAIKKMKEFLQHNPRMPTVDPDSLLGNRDIGPLRLN